MSKKDYKNTLNIFSGNFEMQAKLKEKEPNIRKTWETKDIYNKKISKALKEKKPSFVLHDGPPYSNGNIHVGHALNKILKDFIIRFHSSKGEYTPSIFGWDNHGLPIETAIEKSGVNRKETDPIEFRKICRNYASEQVLSQSAGFRSLGLFTDFSKRYTTLSEEYVLTELRLFQKMVEKKLIYRDSKPIYWSWSSESALAEAEIEYKDIKANTCYVSTKIASSSKKFAGNSIIIWTTLPWTIAANQAVAISKDIVYVRVVNTETKQSYILARDLFNDNLLAKKFGWEKFKITNEIKGQELDGVEYESIWDKSKPNCKIKCADFVTDDAGTGMVGCAGAFGLDDFDFVKSLGIEPFVCVDKQGKFTSLIKDKRLEGAFIEKASKIILEELKNTGQLIATEVINHSFPHDWRTKKPIMYLATSQWFIDIDKCKAEIESVIEKNVFTNIAWNKERLKNIILDRQSWTISRQRLWGVPIIAFYDKNQNPLINGEVVKYAVDVIAKKGVDSWFSGSADDFLPDKYKNKGYTKEKDILDVWFDSGSSSIVLEEVYKIPRPYNLFIEGGDQYRGWFNSSMINSVIYDGKSPYINLASHGMVLDEDGRKMSKSVGNTIDPSEIVSQYGSDILRLWVYSVDYTEDVRIGNEIIKQVIESYRKLRNTIRFLLNNLYDFDPKKHYKKNLSEVDQYSLNTLRKVKDDILKNYEANKFNASYKLLINYVSNSLSSFYLDFTKDILYIYKADDERRRQVQTVLYEQLWMLIDVLRPIIPHTIEEAYSCIQNIDKEESVHLLTIKDQSFECKADIVTKFETLLKLREEINEKLEVAKQEGIIKKGFEAVVTIKIKKEYSYLKDIENIAQILILNKLFFNTEFLETEENCISEVDVKPATGEKCQRCWGLYDNLSKDDICASCDKVVNGK